MKRYVSLLICLCTLLTLLSGCIVPENPTTESGDTNFTTDPTGESQPPIPEGVKMPTVDEDYFVLLCRNCDITYHLNAGVMANWEMVYLLSAQNPAGKTLSIETNLGSGEIILPEAEADYIYTLPLSAFMTYQGVDWKALAADPETASEASNYWKGIYKQVESSLPTLYAACTEMTFEMLGIDTADPEELQKIEYIKVTFDGKTETYTDIGMFVTLAGGYGIPLGYQDWGSSSYASTGCPVDPSSEGILKTTYGWTVTAKKDVVLESLSIFDHEEIELVSCNLKISSPTSGMVEMEWDGASPLELDEGTKVEISATFRDPALAGKFESLVFRVFTLSYTCNGESKIMVYPVSFRINANPFDVYVKDVDGIDMMDYYRDYWEVIYAA